MKRSFTTTFAVDQTPKQAFDAITNVRGWWSEDIQGGSARLGDEFTYRYEDLHYSKQRLIEVVPDKKVVWLIEDAHLSFVKDKKEWTGTKVVFEVTPKGKKTEIRFTHEGLVPEFECYDACSSAWSSYVTGSLRKLIATGKGDPNLEDEG